MVWLQYTATRRQRAATACLFLTGAALIAIAAHLSYANIEPSRAKAARRREVFEAFITRKRAAAGAAPAVASRRPPLRLLLGRRAGGASGACWLLTPKMTGAGAEARWTEGAAVEVDASNAPKRIGPAATPKPAESPGFDAKAGPVCPTGGAPLDGLPPRPVMAAQKPGAVRPRTMAAVDHVKSVRADAKPWC